MLRVQVCATHIGGFLGPKFSKQGPLFGRFSLNIGGFARNKHNNVQFSVKIHHKSVYVGIFW